MATNINISAGLTHGDKEWIVAALQDALNKFKADAMTHLKAADARYQADMTAIKDKLTALQNSVDTDPAPVIKDTLGDVITFIDNMDSPATLPPNLGPTDPNAAPSGNSTNQGGGALNAGPTTVPSGSTPAPGPGQG